MRSSAPLRTAPRFLFLLVIACTTVLGGCSDAVGSPPEGPEGPGRGGLEDAVAHLVNNHRERLGCRRLVWNNTLAGVALKHSVDMLERDYFDHYDPEGKGLRERLAAARIGYLDAAENIAKGFRYDDAARAVFDGWLASPEHRKIIENCTYVVHGMGFADYRWTHVFMR